jgi:hypothetical protein
MSYPKVLPNDELNDIDDEEFGLTDEEYRDILEDIDRVIAEANRKWDYSGKYITKTESKKEKPSVESVMIARGLIKTRRVPISTNNRIPVFVELEKRKEVKI